MTGRKWAPLLLIPLLLLLPFPLIAKETAPFQEARWIWVDAPAASRDLYAYFRKDFQLPALPADFRLAVTADTSYQLFINGRYLARGPVRSDPARKYYDLFSRRAKELLEIGANSIAVKVHWNGEGTFSTMVGRPGLLLEASGRLGQEPWRLASDRSWASRISRNHSREAIRINPQLGFNEVYDATVDRSEVSWFEADQDLRGWVPAREVGEPISGPFRKLLARDIPFQTNRIEESRRLQASGTAEPVKRETIIDLSALLPKPASGSQPAQPGQEETRVLYLYTEIFSPGKQDVTFNIEASQVFRVWLNGELELDYDPRQAGINLVDSGSLRLEEGWNPLLIKAVAGDDFRISPRRAASPLIFSSHRDSNRPGWSARGPYPVTLSRRVLGLYPVWLDFGTRSQPPEREYLESGRCRMDDNWRDARASSREITSIARSMAMAVYAPLPSTRLKKTKSGWLISGDSDQIVYLVFDFGQEVNGYPIFDFSAMGEGVLEAGYSEVPSQDHLNPYRANANYADRFRAAPGKNHWELFEKRAFRYVQLQFRGFNGPIELEAPSIRLTTYPVEARGSFSSSDPRLNTLWNASLQTLRMSMEDMFIDCPWRERTQWWGDARVQALANYYHSADPRLVRKGLRDIAYSQREDGLTYAAYPTSLDWLVAPEFTMLWVFSLEEYHRYTADRGLVEELYPHLKRAMSWFERHEDTSGLLSNLPHLLWVDWSAVETRGEVTAINCYYVETLRRAAALAQLLGDQETGRIYLARADSVRGAVNRYLWDPREGVYRDARLEGRLSPVISQQANTLAILFDVAPRERWDGILERIHGARPDIVQVGTPFFSFYVLESLLRADRVDAALTELLRWYPMTQQPPGTFWEYWLPYYSRSHGWSCAPSILLPEAVLGVVLTSPGYAAFEVRPRFTRALEWARGTVPLVGGGEIRVGWERLAGSFRLDLRSPRESRPRLRLPLLFQKHQVSVYEFTPTGWTRLEAPARETGGEIRIDLPRGGEFQVRIQSLEGSR